MDIQIFTLGLCVSQIHILFERRIHMIQFKTVKGERGREDEGKDPSL